MYRRTALIEPLPPELQKIRLNASRSDLSVRFRPAAGIATEKDLAGELSRQRTAYAHYLRDLAPPLEETRIRVSLAEFDWRIETAEDRLDFPSTLAGAGRWEKVRILHYGAPVGRAGMIAKGSLFLRFDGVDYRAHVFVNGSYLMSHEGFFAPFQAECTAHVRAGENVALVKVENDYIHMGNADPTPDGQPGKRWEGEKLYAATGHPLATGFQPDDFKFWYDASCGYIMPLLGSTLEAPEWETILSTGHLSWAAESTPAQAAVQRRLGKGVLRFCQVRLAGRLIGQRSR